MPMLDTDLLSDLQNALMEAPAGADGGVTWISGLWTQTEVLNRLSERSNRFLKATALLVSQSAPIPVPARVSRVALPQDWLITRDVYWQGEDGVNRWLVPSDTFEADHGSKSWETTAGTPLVYFDVDLPLLEIGVAPIPNVNGQLTVFYVAQGAPMDGTGQPLTVPDEYESALAFGTLNDLLGKDGRGANPDKAIYASLRYSLLIEVASLLLTGGMV